MIGEVDVVGSIVSNRTCSVLGELDGFGDVLGPSQATGKGKDQK